MKLPIGQQTRSVNGIEERGGKLYFGFDLAESADGSTLRKYYSYAELRAIPGNLDELCEIVAIYDHYQCVHEIFRSEGHSYWNERCLYEAELWMAMEAALKEEPPRVIEITVTPDMIGTAGKPGTKAIPGILIDECANVKITVVKPAPVISLFHASMVDDDEVAA